MNLLSTLMKLNEKAKGFLPASTVQWFRSRANSLAFLWRKEFYSQYGEDAILQGIFRDLAGQCESKPRTTETFYVDVGAFAPIQHSNTYWFYRRGWRGINIEAAPGSMKVFDRVRPRDINLEVAVSSTEGKVTFYSWGAPNVVNTISKERAEQLAREFQTPPTETVIQCLTLEHILDRWLPAGQAIGFLNVDVENQNFAVLKSGNWRKHRPRLVAVESDDDSPTLDEILKSPMAAFLHDNGYQLRAWVKPTLIFQRLKD